VKLLTHPGNGLVHIVAGPAGQSIEVDALVFEAGMFIYMPAMTAIAGRRLPVFFPDRIRLCMNGMASRAIDGSPVMRAADEMNNVHAGSRFGMAAHAGLELIFSWRNLRPTSKCGQRRESAAAVSTGNMDAARSMAGLATPAGCGGVLIILISMRTGGDSPHFFTGMATQAVYGPVFSVDRSAFHAGTGLWFLCQRITRREE